MWGLDTRLVGWNDSLAVVAPQTTYSLMSYCVGDSAGQGRWIGKRDYEQLHSGDRGPISGDDAVAGGPGVVFRGTLRETRLTPVESHGEPVPGAADTAGDNSIFAVVVPAGIAGVARVEVRAEGSATAVASAVASPATPTVSVPAPTMGTPERVNFTWLSHDADGTALKHTVLYGPDDGATWNVVALDVSGSSVSVPRTSLPGSSTARVRVVASDGVRSTAATSPTFVLPNLAPEVNIESPLTGTTVTAAQSLVMSASAYDAEDGALDGRSVQWLSDRNGVLGTGVRVLRRADTLAKGVHTITVRATDSGGRVSEQSVQITVSRLATPPPPASTYAFGGFTEPVSATVNVANAGRTIPLKWTVTGTGVDDSVVTDAVFDADGATYAMRGSGDTWHVNVQTPKEWAGTVRTFRVRLADGTVHEVRFQFQ